MGLLECASSASVWRGYDYYKQNKVKDLVETAQGVFTADVEGSNKEPRTHSQLHGKLLA